MNKMNIYIPLLIILVLLLIIYISDKEGFESNLNVSIVNDNYNNAKNKLKIAEDNQTDAIKNIETDTNNLLLVINKDNAQKSLTSAQIELNIAKSNINDAKKILDNAEDELKTKNTNLLTAQSELSIKQISLSIAEGFTIIFRQTAVDIAKSNVFIAQTAVNNAQTAVNNAQTIYNNAQTILPNKQTKFNEESNNYTIISNRVSSNLTIDIATYKKNVADNKKAIADLALKTAINNLKDAEYSQKYAISNSISIDRIKTYNSNYAYCLGGNIMCPSGNLIDINDDYNNTYNYLCDDNKTQPICNNNLNMTNEELINYNIDGISFPFSTSYTGFTVEYNDIPFVNNLQDSTIDFFKNGNLIKKMKNCKFLNTNSCID